jgi:radical SAM superfamily enzyme YgiQ (UPF0313 family)
MSDSLLNPIVNDLSQELSASEKAIYWDGYLRADNHVCDTENTFKWRRGGFYRARLGIESGSPRILELMDKRITPDQIRSALASLALAGIKTSTYWVIGYPGETEEDFQQTLDLIELMKDDIYEAECNPFRFYLSGQVQSQEWAEKNNCRPLYPGNARQSLILQTWITEDEHTPREVIYRRLNRFVNHCRQIGIPNPYTVQDIHQADLRWQKLHNNAVPPLVMFKDGSIDGDECRNIQEPIRLKPIRDDGDFDF